MNPVQKFFSFPIKDIVIMRKMNKICRLLLISIFWNFCGAYVRDVLFLGITLIYAGVKGVVCALIRQGTRALLGDGMPCSWLGYGLWECLHLSKLNCMCNIYAFPTYVTPSWKNNQKKLKVFRTRQFENCLVCKAIEVSVNLSKMATLKFQSSPWSKHISYFLK